MSESIELPIVPNVLPATAEPTPGAGESYYERLARTVRVDDTPPGEGQTYESADQREARRLTERMPAGYRPTSAVDMTFDPRLAYELALGVSSPSEVFSKYEFDTEAATRMISNPAFIATVKKYKDEIQEGGVSFKLKARIQAEDLLTHSYILATDPETPASVRADMIKWTARVADLEPRGNDKASGPAGGFTLNISFAGDRSVGRTIEGEV
jgi:hypothetical protein